MRVYERIAVIPVVILSFLGPLYGQAVLRDLPPGKWWKDQRVIQQLNLSPDQQARVESIWVKSRKQLIDMKAEADKLQVDLEDLISKDTVDEKAALAALDQVQAAKSRLERATFLMRIQIKNALTPEQQQKLQTLWERLRRERNPQRPPPLRALEPLQLLQARPPMP